MPVGVRCLVLKLTHRSESLSAGRKARHDGHTILIVVYVANLIFGVAVVLSPLTEVLSTDGTGYLAASFFVLAYWSGARTKLRIHPGKAGLKDFKRRVFFIEVCDSSIDCGFVGTHVHAFNEFR